MCFTDLMLCEIWMVQPVTSGGITRVIQQEYDATGSCIFRVLNEFLHHIAYILSSSINNLLLDRGDYTV